MLLDYNMNFSDKNNSLSDLIMKKIFSLLAMALSLAFVTTSCDDNDLPDVDINIAVSNAEIVDHQMYVVRGDTLKIESINVRNNEAGKPAAITEASYYWDGYFLGEAWQAPFAFNIVTTKPTAELDGTALGAHRPFSLSTRTWHLPCCPTPSMWLKASRTFPPAAPPASPTTPTCTPANSRTR